MKLREKQSLFAKLLPRLIDYAYSLGYELTLGEAWRSEEQAKWYADRKKGTMNSLHIIRLAIDLNLFKSGVFLDSSEAHRQLGEYWKSLHPLCRWGGDFKPKPDGNHYSLEHEGRK